MFRLLIIMKRNLRKSRNIEFALVFHFQKITFTMAGRNEIEYFDFLMVFNIRVRLKDILIS